MSWQSATVGDLVSLRRGHDLTENDRKVGTVPVVGSAGPNGFHNQAIAKGPGVVIGRSGASIGKITYVPSDYWPHNTCIYVTDFKGNDPRFVAYLLSTLNLAQLNSGAAQPSLNRNFVYPVRVRYPDPQDQSRIASVLSSYDELIENNRRRIQLLEQAARQLYKEWFVHHRFPGHEHVKIKNGVPEGWEKKPLGELLTLQRGFDLPVSKRKEGHIPIYASTGINGYHVEAKVAGPGVVTGRSGSLGKVMYVIGDFWPLNTTLWVKEFKLVKPLFATHLLESMQLEQYNGGAAVPTLNRNDVHRVEVLCPSKVLLDLFEEYVGDIMSQLDTLKKASSKLANARELLLPRLMSGEIAA
ncbi:MAG: restriction endonuclease subunit S [Candidatus Thiodiazotropha sp.]